MTDHSASPKRAREPTPPLDTDLRHSGPSKRVWQLRDVLADAMQNAWDDFCSDSGCFPDCIRVEKGRGVELSAKFACGNFTLWVAQSLDAFLASESAASPPSDGTTTPPPSAGIPRRIDTRRWVPAERAIQDAVDSVERMPGDVRLTDAVILLGKARDAVADFVDAQEAR